MQRKPQPNTRNWQAVAAHQRNSAGPMGGGKRDRNRRNRKAVRQSLRKGDHV